MTMEYKNALKEAGWELGKETWVNIYLVKKLHLNDQKLGKMCNLDVKIDLLHLIHKESLEITKSKINTPAEKMGKKPEQTKQEI